MRNAGDPAGNAAFVQHQAAFVRQCPGRIRQGETDQFLGQRLPCLDLQAALPEVERLVAGQRPVQPDFQRLGEPVGIVANDEMAHFQAQQALRIDAERSEPGSLTSLHQRLPDVHDTLRRRVDFVGQVGHEAHVDDTRSQSGNLCLDRAAVVQRHQIGRGQPFQHRSAKRTGDVERAVTAGEVDDGRVQSPHLQASRHLAVNRCRVRGTGGEVK
ncbi:hypothetical protein GALL_300770 [mine drainage metagenome]|uniref:Uncharacterized protein n=1 Tax=mine drainage metagenome TaxID=410659 RepID=A0A1J5QWK7_9ZZZZ